MRTLVVHPGMNIKGGGEQVAIHTISALLKASHKVVFISEEFDAGSFENFYQCKGLFDNVDLLFYPAFKPMMGRGLLLYQRLIHHQRQIRRLLQHQQSFDLVLSTQDIGFTPRVSAPLVQYCHFPEYFRHLESNSKSLLWNLYYEPARRFYRNRAHLTSLLLSNSEYTRGFVRKLWNSDSIVLYPPCHTELYKAGPKEGSLAVTVGRLVPEKRLNLFLEIAKLLPTYKFTVIGSIVSPTYSDSLTRNAPSNVEFLTSSQRKSPEVLAKAKVYVHCMENEHFGIAIAEAMAAGCVPVVHDSGGPREVVIPAVGYRWQTVEEAARQVEMLMNDEDLRSRLSEAARERSVLYSSQRFEDGLVKLVESHIKT